MEVDRRGPGFTRLAVTVSDGRSVAVDIGQDARIRPAVQLSCGRVLDHDEVAADKTLAVFGRAAARDLVDMAALSRRYSPPERLVSPRSGEGPGFDSRVLADALRAAGLGLSRDDIRQLKTYAEEVRALLLETGDKP